MKKTIILILIVTILGFPFTLQARELAMETIQVYINVNEYVDLDFYEENDLLSDGPELILDLAEEVTTEISFKTTANFPITLALESEYGFNQDIEDADDVNQYFEYFIYKVVENEEDRVEYTFSPNSDISPEIITDNPGKENWKLGLRLTESIAEQWLELLDLVEQGVSITEIEEVDWTQLAAGNYEDLITITIEKD